MTLSIMIFLVIIHNDDDLFGQASPTNWRGLPIRDVLWPYGESIQFTIAVYVQ